MTLIDEEGYGNSHASLDATLNGVAADFNRWRREQGLDRRVYLKGGKKKIHTIYVSDEAYSGLNFLAKTFETYFGAQASVSGLLEALGTFQLRMHDEIKPESNDYDKPEN